MEDESIRKDHATHGVAQPPISGAELRLQVVVLADLAHQRELGLGEVDVRFGVF